MGVSIDVPIVSIEGIARGNQAAEKTASRLL
jgi:hypothetical protein